MQSSWLWAGSPFLFHSASGVLRGQSVWLRTTHHAACSRMLHCWNTYGSCESLLFCYGIEGVVHPKMKILSSFIHPQVFLTYFLLWNINVWVLFLNGSQSYLVPNFLHKLLFLRKKEMHVWNDVNFHFCVDCPFNKHLSNLHMGYKLPFLRKWLVELNRRSLSLSDLHCVWYVVCVFVAVCTFDFTAQVFFM